MQIQNAALVSLRSITLNETYINKFKAFNKLKQEMKSFSI